MIKGITLGYLLMVLCASENKNSYPTQEPDRLKVTSYTPPGSYAVHYKGSRHEGLTLMIFDITGKYIYLKNYYDFEGELKENIDLSPYPKGIYIIEIETPYSREARKIIYQ